MSTGENNNDVAVRSFHEEDDSSWIYAENKENGKVIFIASIFRLIMHLKIEK
jgi:hypothetical protein